MTSWNARVEMEEESVLIKLVLPLSNHAQVPQSRELYFCYLLLIWSWGRCWVQGRLFRNTGLPSQKLHPYWILQWSYGEMWLLRSLDTEKDAPVWGSSLHENKTQGHHRLCLGPSSKSGWYCKLAFLEGMCTERADRKVGLNDLRDNQYQGRLLWCDTPSLK